MRLRAAALASVVVLALFAAACSVKYGREFPSPKLDSIINGRTAKADLVRMFGEPTQVGIKDGDQTWTWYHGQEGKQGGVRQATGRHLQQPGRGEVPRLLVELPGGHEGPLTDQHRYPGREPADVSVVPVLLLVVLIWGGSYSAIKATQPFFPPLAFAAFRCAVAAAVLAAVAWPAGALRPAVPAPRLGSGRPARAPRHHGSSTCSW